jgi:hypothetical protein
MTKNSLSMQTKHFLQLLQFSHYSSITILPLQPHYNLINNKKTAYQYKQSTFYSYYNSPITAPLQSHYSFIINKKCSRKEKIKAFAKALQRACKSFAKEKKRFAKAAKALFYVFTVFLKKSLQKSLQKRKKDK